MTTAIQSAVNTATSSATTNTAKNTLGKDSFMKMMIAQLQNQDPLNPMDGTAFVAQLAQFTSLEQLQNLNDVMSALPGYLNNFSNAQMANLIGSEATAAGNVLNVTGSTTKISYQLPSDIQSGTVKIFNSNGALVDTVRIGSQKTGLQSTTWNSSSQSPGNYTYEVSAVDRSGAEVTVNKMISGQITGVSFKDGKSYLTINGQQVAFTDVAMINKTTI
jgi:flagellar basal-body rod modification protein FlgD